MSIEQTRTLLQPVLADLARVVEHVRPDQLGDPTPCTEYDVRTLLGHTVGWLENFAAAFASPDGRTQNPDAGTPDIPLDEAAGRIRAAADRADTAVRDGGADRQVYVASPDGMPGAMMLSMVLGEYIAHGWDLAAATRQGWRPADAAVDEAHAFMSGMMRPEYRGGPDGMMAEVVPVPAEAPALDRYLGFAGRDPGWTPPASRRRRSGLRPDDGRPSVATST